MKKDLRNIIIGFILGLLTAWLLGLNNSAQTPASEPAIKTAETSVPSALSAIPSTAKNISPVVARPTLPPVRASQFNSSESDYVSAKDAAELKQYRVKAIKNNLRQISGAAQQYMMSLGVSTVNYTDLVGTTTDNLMHNVSPVMGEDYSGLYLQQSTTELSVVAPDGTTITFDQ